MRKQAACPKCSNVFDLATTGTIKGIGVLGAALLGVRFHPMIGVGLGIVSLLWGDKIEEAIKARCPACHAALKIVGTVYG